MASYWSTYGNPDWYKQNIKPQDAQTQANRLGISTDQLFQLYAQTNLPGYGGGTIPSGGLQPTQEQLMQFARGPGLAGAAQQQQGGPQPYGPQPGTTSQGILQQTPHGSIQPSGYQGWAIPAPPSASGAALSGMYGPMATWQNVTGQGNQPASGTPGLGQFAQLSPQQFQFTPPQQVVPKLTGQTIVPTAQPGAQPVVPVKQFQSGGLVTSQPSAPANYYGTQYPLYATNAQGNPTGQAIYANPEMQGELLGAAALQMPAVINPPPSGTPSSKSGVAPTGGALVGTSVPQVGWGTNEASWDQVAQTAGLSGRDITEFAKAGYTPAQIAQKFNVATPLGGPWQNPQIGSVFTPVARTAPTMALGATPLQPAAQPTATAYNPTPTPFAQAPPAPGLNIPQIPPQMNMGAGATPPQMTGQPAPIAQSPLMTAHTNALADAGQVLFRHLTGGDPSKATPEKIADFHSQLTDAITNYTAGAARGGPGVTALAAAQQPTAARKMQSGGPVPGRGDKDTVPALLTPGEYVIPKQQVQQLMRTGRLPIKMADGGTVPDSDSNAPPEARRKTLTTAAQTQSTPPPAAPGGGYSGPSLVPGLAAAAHTYASSIANLPRNPIGSAGGGPDIRNTRLDPDPDIPSLKAAGMMGGGGLSSPGAQSALGGVASGLEQASKAIAASALPWQPQQNAIPAPPPAPAAPQFTQPPAPQQAQQGVNPYAAYAMNQARYPTSPYYS